ncbi:MAG: molecular chaperone [Acetobacteraceae bacterium]|jgi:fimbrial chaperone protein
MRPILALAVLMLLGCPLAREVQAASLEISPVLVTLAAGQTAATIEVTNHGGAPSAIQARVYRWTQAGDDDALAPTHDIIVSPPIFTIADGGSQTMRLLLRGGIAAGAERSYRLLLDEVPPPNMQNRHVVFALRLSLPVIVRASSSGRPTLQWRAQRGASGQTMLTASNAGAAYDKVRAIDVTLADGSHPKVVSRGTNSYILGGAERHWIVQDPHGGPGGPLHLSVTSLTGKSELILTP